MSRTIFIILLMFISVGLILLGWNIGNKTISIIGSLIFVVRLILDLYEIYLGSKKYVKNEDMDFENSNKQKMNILAIIEKIISHVIIYSSLIGVILLKGQDDIYIYPPLIIWGSVWIAYFLGGIIIEKVAKIPLRMTYGGWKATFGKIIRK